MVNCVSSGIELQWLQQCHHIHNDMFFVCAAILFQSPLLFLTCVVATQALFVAMVGGWAECLEVGNPEPTDEAPALTLVNHLWWQLLSPYLKTAGNIISTYYAEDPEVYFKKQRNDRHLDFHELGYPQSGGRPHPHLLWPLCAQSFATCLTMWGIGFSKFGCGVPQHLSVGSSQRPLWSHWHRRFASWSIQDGSCSSQRAWKRSRVWKSCWRSVKHSWIDWGVHDWLQGSKGLRICSPVTCPQSQSTSWPWLLGLGLEGIRKRWLRPDRHRTHGLRILTHRTHGLRPMDLLGSLGIRKRWLRWDRHRTDGLREVARPTSNPWTSDLLGAHGNDFGALGWMECDFWTLKLVTGDFEIPWQVTSTSN